MPFPLKLHPDRLFPVDPDTRAVARRLHAQIEGLPIVSPHGHTDPAWFAENQNWANPAELLITPDHYVLRMLFSQGVALEDLGVPRADGGPVETDPRTIWRRFAERYHLFRGTPSRMWHDWVYAQVFGLNVRLSAETADHYYDVIDAALKTEAFRPHALFERYNIEVIATTESPLDPLEHHATIKASGWSGKVVTAFRPDPVLDPDFEGFHANLDRLSAITGEDTGTWEGYLAAMSLDDGLVMQIHPGSFRNHNAGLFERFGRDKGADIPTGTNYVSDLKPLLDRLGSEPGLTIIVFTLDETSYARELAPLAGHYPALRLGPPWWFHDSPEGMRRFREQATETAGFYNTVGFNDDTRAFLSIPARHDVARRMDCGWLARLVVEHRMEEDEAHELARALTYDLVKSAYRL